MKEQPIPEVWWKVVSYTGSDAENVAFEIAYGYLSCVASVATWWHQFHIQFARVMNVNLHVFRYLVVKDMFLGDNAGSFELVQECLVCLYHLGILAVLHVFNKDGIAVDFHHNNYVFVATERLDGVLACLVGEHGFAYHERLGVHIANLLAVEMGGVACFQRCCLNFGGLYIHSCLVQVPLCSFGSFGIVLLDIVFYQYWPSYVVSCFDGFEPSQFEPVSTDGVHPFDGLLSRRKIVNAVGLL